MAICIFTKLPIKMEGYLDKEKSQKKKLLIYMAPSYCGKHMVNQN
jgi:hypothetical protein